MRNIESLFINEISKSDSFHFHRWDLSSNKHFKFEIPSRNNCERGLHCLVNLFHLKYYRADQALLSYKFMTIKLPNHECEIFLIIL
jgi:hypothetical protein